MSASTITPPELARRWGTKPHHIIGLISRGELKAFNVALTPGGKPRWRINLSDVLDFELRRSAKAPVKQVRRRRKKQASDFLEYF